VKRSFLIVPSALVKSLHKSSTSTRDFVELEWIESRVQSPWYSSKRLPERERAGFSPW